MTALVNPLNLKETRPMFENSLPMPVRAMERYPFAEDESKNLFDDPYDDEMPDEGDDDEDHLDDDFLDEDEEEEVEDEEPDDEDLEEAEEEDDMYENTGDVENDD